MDYFEFIILLLFSLMGSTQACSSAAIRPIFGQAIGRGAAAGARGVVQNVEQQAKNQVISKGGQVVKMTLKERLTDIGGKVARESVKVGGQAVVFGGVDAVGDALPMLH